MEDEIEDVEDPIENPDSEQEDVGRLKEAGFSDEDLASFGIKVEQVDGVKVEESSPVVAEDAPVTNSQQLETNTDELQQLAAFGKQWQDAFLRDPKQAALSILNTEAFTPEMRQAIIENLSTSIPKTDENAFNPSTYEPQSDLEKALLPALDWVNNGERIVSEAIAQRDEDIRTVYAQAVGLEQKLNAIVQLLDAKLPDFDMNESFALFTQNTAITLEDAIKQTYGRKLEEFTKLEKQKKTQRPETLRNTGSATKSSRVKPGMSMYDAWQETGAMMGVE